MLKMLQEMERIRFDSTRCARNRILVSNQHASGLTVIPTSTDTSWTLQIYQSDMNKPPSERYPYPSSVPPTSGETLKQLSVRTIDTASRLRLLQDVKFKYRWSRREEDIWSAHEYFGTLEISLCWLWPKGVKQTYSVL